MEYLASCRLQSQLVALLIFWKHESLQPLDKIIMLALCSGVQLAKIQLASDVIKPIE